MTDQELKADKYKNDIVTELSKLMEEKGFIASENKLFKWITPILLTTVFALLILIWNTKIASLDSIDVEVNKKIGAISEQVDSDQKQIASINNNIKILNGNVKNVCKALNVYCLDITPLPTNISKQ